MPPIIVQEQKFAESTNAIEYSPITSCMTVTCVLQGNVLVGGHFTVTYAQHIEGILNQMLIRIGGRTITAIYIAGAFTFWDTGGKYPQFETNNAMDTYCNRLCAGHACKVYGLELDGNGNRPRFELVAGTLRATDQLNNRPLNDDFDEYNWDGNALTPL